MFKVVEETQRIIQVTLRFIFVEETLQDYKDILMFMVVEETEVYTGSLEGHGCRGDSCGLNRITECRGCRGES